MVTQAMPYPCHPRLLPTLVMDRGGVYIRPESPFWMMRYLRGHDLSTVGAHEHPCGIRVDPHAKAASSSGSVLW